MSSAPARSVLASSARTKSKCSTETYSRDVLVAHAHLGGAALSALHRCCELG